MVEIKINWKRILYRIPILNIFCFVIAPITFYGELARENIELYSVPKNELIKYFTENDIKKYNLTKEYEDRGTVRDFSRE